MDILDSLNPQQREAVLVTDGPILIPVSYTHLTLPTICSV